MVESDLAVKLFIMYDRVINQTVCITHGIHAKRNQAKSFQEEG